MIKLDPLLPISNSQLSTLERRQRDFKVKMRCIEQLRNAQLINKKLIMHKNGVFPELQSNNPKKTFDNLISRHKMSQISPLRRYQPSPYCDKQTKGFYNQGEIYASRLQKIGSRKGFQEDVEKGPKIGKSFSQSKRVTHLQQLQTEMQEIRRPEKIHKAMTEQSAASTASRKIYEKLSRLKDKNQIVTIQSSQQLPEKDTLKSYKHSSFVLKFKVAQSHQQEKAQLAMIKNSKNQNLTNQLTENIKVKNYTKFFDYDFDRLK